MNKQNIKKHLRRTFSALAIAGALLSLPSAEAGRPITARGSWTGCQNITDVQPGDLYTIITWSVTIDFIGAFTGSYEGTERDVVYTDGYFTAISSDGIFTGSVSGRSGTVVMTYEAAGSPPGHIISPWIVNEGTGDLAGLHGQGTWPHVIEHGATNGCDDTFSGDYTGQIQFAQ
jgi:Protein of unknown function (DUF3224)